MWIRKRNMLTAAALAIVFAGCEDGVRPGAEAEIEAAVSGAEAQPDRRSSSPSNSEQPSMQQNAASSGTIDVRARVYIQSAAGEWREITLLVVAPYSALRVAENLTLGS